MNELTAKMREVREPGKCVNERNDFTPHNCKLKSPFPSPFPLKLKLKYEQPMPKEQLKLRDK